MNTNNTKVLSLLLTCFVTLFSLSAPAQIKTSYATSGRTTFEVDWTHDKPASLQWQRSTDQGKTWTNISGATNTSYKVTPTDGTYLRVVINSPATCYPTTIERQIRLVSFSLAITAKTFNSVTCSFKNFDFKDARIVEYGMCYNRSELSTRTYDKFFHQKIGDTPPTGTAFTYELTGLMPGTSYRGCAYFKTRDGSVVYSPEISFSTTHGLKWHSEDWVIQKNLLNPRVALTGGTLSKGPVLKYGEDKNNLTEAEMVLDKGTYKTKFNIMRLQAGKEYYFRVEATVGGKEQVIEKWVRTLPDYPIKDYPVDNTTKNVAHKIVWDSYDKIEKISPSGWHSEYPRMIRVNDRKLLVAYHTGAKDNAWQDIATQISYDNGVSWTTPTIVLDKRGGSTYGQKFWRFTNPELTKLQNGWIMMSVTANGKPEINENCHVLTMISKDEGETWSDPVIVGRGRTWEPMVVQLPKGELELYVSSEADWWDDGIDWAQRPQRIVFARSTDMGETWTEWRTASYSPLKRDGMPCGIVLQGNKGVLYSIEIVNDGGWGSPSMVRRDLNGEWDAADWNGVNTNYRWHVNMGMHGGGPHSLQLPTGEVVLQAHGNAKINDWHASRPTVMIGNNNGKSFGEKTEPMIGLPNNEGCFYNSLFLKDDDTIWLVMTHTKFNVNGNNLEQIQGDIVRLQGKIVKK